MSLQSTQVPGYPRYVHHANQEPKLVRTPEEEAALGEGWTEAYQFRSYPRQVFHPTLAPGSRMQPARIGPNNVIEEEARIVTAPGRIVKSEAEFKGLGKGWYGSPAEFPETPAKPDKADAQAAELDALRAENAKLKAATAAAAPAPVKS